MMLRKLKTEAKKMFEIGLACFLGGCIICGVKKINEEEDKEVRRHRRELIKAEARGYRRGFSDGRTY